MKRACDGASDSPRKIGAASILSGFLLLLCALSFYYFAVLRIDFARTQLLDLPPEPDAPEYFAQARSLSDDGWPAIRIGRDRLPSRYPPGYPVLMLPWLKVLPEDAAVLAPFRTNQTMGLLLLLAVFAFYLYLGRPVTGGLAALVTATLPGFFTFFRSPLSEPSACVLIVLAVMFTFLGLDEGRRWKIYLSAFLLGLSLNVRLQSIFFAPLLLAIALSPVAETRARRLLHCGGAALVLVLAASPVFVLNAFEFGSPFRTGYGFWLPTLSEQQPLFSIDNVATNLRILGSQLTLQPIEFNIANIFGTGVSFVPAFVVLVGVGVRFVRISRFTACAFLAGSCSLIATLSYRWGGVGRFYLPLLVLLVGVAVLPVRWAASCLVARRRIPVALAVLATCGAACLGFPSSSVRGTDGIGRLQALDALRLAQQPARSRRFDAQLRFAAISRGRPAIVLSDIDPAYLNALLPRSSIAAPIDGKHNYNMAREWRYGHLQAQTLVERGLKRSVPVFALFASRDEMAIHRSRLPAIPGYRWHTARTDRNEAGVLRLTAIRSRADRPTERQIERPEVTQSGRTAGSRKVEARPGQRTKPDRKPGDNPVDFAEN